MPHAVEPAGGAPAASRSSGRGRRIGEEQEGRGLGRRREGRSGVGIGLGFAGTFLSRGGIGGRDIPVSVNLAYTAKE
jgi:hypothetical protein